MKRIRSVTVGGKRCRVIWRSLAKEDAIGLAYPDQLLIEIDPKWDDITIVDTLIHEYLHQACPDMCEEKVEQMGVEIALMLDRADLIKKDDDE